MVKPKIKLPKLKENQKYYVVTTKEGYAYRSLSYSKDKQKSIDNYLDFTKLIKYTNPSYKVEIIPAKTMNEVRDIVKGRGKTDYLITGDSQTTYAYRQWLRNFGLKSYYDRIDGKRKFIGYRGKLSPEQVKEIKKKDLVAQKSIEYTPKEQQESRVVRAEKRSKKLEKQADRLEKSGSSHLKQAKLIGDVIPMGQPILVGHYSESRHRSDIKKIRSYTSKGYEELNKAEQLRKRSENVVRIAKRIKGTALQEYEKRIKLLNEKIYKGVEVRTVWNRNKIGKITRIYKRSVHVQYPGKEKTRKVDKEALILTDV